MTTTIANKASELVKKLDTETLVEFAKTAPSEIIDIVMNELEVRMPESEFIDLCNTLLA